MLRHKGITAAAVLVTAAAAQTQPDQFRSVLSARHVDASVISYQLQHYLAKRIPELPKPGGAEVWTRESQRLRREFLDKVIFRGWPREWREAPPRFEDVGLAYSGPLYRIRKLRYEIVPGMYGTALLYEPVGAKGRAPAVLNVHGHVGPPGKAIEYKQKRCIHEAKNGIYSLSLEWFGYGDLSHPENSHWNAAHLDLAGVSGVGLFYIAMRKGIDYLAAHPQVDTSRIGVTGLSGGGWQTILLSALDERVNVSVPVAGYSALTARLERSGDIGDIEQNPTDLLTVGDYPLLTAMRAPRPTLIINNAEDDCCFRANLVKERIFDDVRAFFGLFGKPDHLAWHENTDPADHNYQADNRQQSYRFFAKHFGVTTAPEGSAVSREILSPAELQVGIPPDSLTILKLARRTADNPPAGTADLREIVRYAPVTVQHAWARASSKSRGLETRSFRFDFSNGLSATGVWAKAIDAPENAPATIVLNDAGKKMAGAEVSDRVNRGEQVLAVDLLFTGDAAPENPSTALFAQMIATTGARALGLRAAQLAALEKWMQEKMNASGVRLQANGIRSQVAALVSAARHPSKNREIQTVSADKSLRSLFEKPVSYEAAPELFCFGLYPRFDIPELQKMALQGPIGAGR